MPKFSQATIFIRNLPFETTNEEFSAFLTSKVGSYVRCFVVPKDNKSCRGFGYCIFDLDVDAQNAVQVLNGAEFKARKLTVHLADAPGQKTKQDGKDPKKPEAKKPYEAKKPETTHKKAEPEVKKEVTPKKTEVKKEVKKEKEEGKAVEKTDAKEVKEGKEVKKEEVKKTDEEKAAEAQARAIARKEAREQAKKEKELLESSSRHIILRDLPKDIKKRQIKNKLAKFGRLEEYIFPLHDDNTTALVSFTELDNAIKAQKKFSNNHEIAPGTKIRCEFVNYPQMKKHRLIVRNLPFKCSVADLKELFSKYGPIDEINIPLKNEKNSGFGFVQFIFEADALKAIKDVNGKSLKDRTIAVDICLPKGQYTGATNASLSEKTDDKEEDNADDNNNNNEESKEEKVEETTTSKTATNKESKEDELKKTFVLLNVPYDATEEELKSRLAQYGNVEYALLVKDKVTNHFTGTAFAKFADLNAVTNLNEDLAIQKQLLMLGDDNKTTKNEHQRSTGNTKKLYSDAEFREPGIMFKGRKMIVKPAVAKERVVDIKEAKERKREKDKRNLYLATEGYIHPESPAAQGLAPAYLDKIQRSYREKKLKLKNPNFSVSKTRLSVRNLPKNVTDKEMKKIFLDSITEKTISEFGKPAIRQVKILEETTGKSKGIGFVEFLKHEHALNALRELNNNPKIFGNTQRLMVEFALENAVKVKNHKKVMELGKDKSQKLDTNQPATQSSNDQNTTKNSNKRKRDDNDAGTDNAKNKKQKKDDKKPTGEQKKSEPKQKKALDSKSSQEKDNNKEKKDDVRDPKKLKRIRETDKAARKDKKKKAKLDGRADIDDNLEKLVKEYKTRVFEGDNGDSNAAGRNNTPAVKKSRWFE